MKRHDVAQGSFEWMLLHVGVPTASQFDALVTPLFERRKGQTPETFLAKKLAEAWQAGPLPGFGAWATEQGQILEPRAVSWFEYEHNVTIDRVGFCTTDDGRVGCSPDGLLGEDSGIEIKCPNAETHVKYLLSGELPKDYAAQVHGCMYVTDRPEWKFLSYRHQFPPLLLTIERDEEIQEKLHEALTLFLAHFDRAMEYLAEINGGPSICKPATISPGPVKFSWESDPNDVATP